MVFNDGKMTWRELATLIAGMTTEQQDTDVTVYSLSDDEFLPVQQITQTKVADVLDADHPYLVID